ncbi:MAG: DEAD/DEAH box helicase [Kiritimatiellia bacterium]
MSAILHGTFQRQAFCVWHEGQLHSSLPELLARILRLPDSSPLGFPIQLKLRLPANHETPLPSRAFLTENGELPRPDGIRTFDRDAFALAPSSVLRLLGLCLNGPHLHPDILAGGDLLYWSDLLRCAAGLVARGSYLPALIQDHTGQAFLAKWQPQPDADDRKRIQHFIQTIPPVAAQAGTNVKTALSDILDILVRHSVAPVHARSILRKTANASASDAWMAALRAPSPVIHWENSDELLQLQRQIAQWRSPIDAALQTDSRYSLELKLPKNGEAAWQLDFRLIAPNGETFPLSKLDTTARREALLALGHATRIFPPLAQATGIDTLKLPPAAAHQFIHGAAENLQSAGYSIILPQALRQMGLTLALKASVQDNGQQELSTPATLDWSLRLGDQKVTPQQLRALVKAGEPFAQINGTWVEINPEQISLALKEIGKTWTEHATAGDILRYAIGIRRGRGNLPVAAVETGGWLERFLDRLRAGASLQPLPPPAGFQGTLRPYQARGYGWLDFLRQWGFGGCLADDMGLGKTIQALALVLKVRTEHRQNAPILLVAPLSVLANWQREIKRFAPSLTTILHHGPERTSGINFAHQAAANDIILTSYNLLRQDFQDTLRRVAWEGIILDEAQNIKNPRSGQSNAARALTASFRIALTGTPIENSVTDLWSIMDFLNPNLLGTNDQFREAYARPIALSTSANDPLVQRLGQVTGPFLLRRLKSDKSIIEDLPPKIENKVYCILTPEQTALYRAALDDFRLSLAKATPSDRRGRILAVLTRLKQICNHPAHYLCEANPRLAGRSGKLMRLEEMLSEILSEGDSALVFTQYAQMGRLLQCRLSECFGDDIPFLHGGLTDRARQEMVDRYQRGEGCGIFILSLKAGGLGLNLTRANHVFHYDRWWNPAVENQATDRAYRIGQNKQVMVHTYICSGTLEDRIDELISSKRILADTLVKSGESMLAQLSDEELRAVLTLAADAL